MVAIPVEASNDRPATRLATRIAFLVAGFGIACWAPLVPFAKARLDVDDGVMGALLLCLGVGSVAAMMATGVFSARYGSKPVIVLAGFGLALILPFLTIAGAPFTLAIALALFGASLGSLDVAMNVHAVEVEKAAMRPLMSGFHALFSIGGFLGASAMTFMLSQGATPLFATCLCALAMFAAMLVAQPRLLVAKAANGGPLFTAPRGIVLLLALLALIMFLLEGAVLDWSALLLTSDRLTEARDSGLGYMVFAVAMTVGRLSGDMVTARLGDWTSMLYGGIVALAGLALMLATPVLVAALGGFLLIGLGSSNIVPILFRKAGSQTRMPPGLAIATITTTGYAGILIGPAAIGFLARLAGLHAAFWILAALVSLVPLSAWFIGRTARSP